ncbi:hypothetical protein RDABS01_002826 [Bienertia sinuspersici]
MAIPLSSREPKDEMMWAYSKYGNYLVRSAYLLGKGANLDEFHEAWVDIWKMEVIPKVKHFLWRLCTATLPLKTRLRARHLVEEASCPWCGQAEETMFHLFFECVKSRTLWVDCECGAMRCADSSNTLCDIMKSWRKIEGKVKQRGVYLMWALWADRNAKVFEGKTTPNTILVDRVYRWAEEYNRYAARIYAKKAVNGARCNKFWKAPAAGVIKINSDASLAVEGMVEIAEAKSLVFALEMASRFEVNKVIAETDSLTVVNRVSRGVIHLTKLDSILGDALEQSTCFSHVHWSHVGRQSNTVAHNLAKHTPFGSQQVWVNHSPPEVSSYVLMDMLTMNE